MKLLYVMVACVLLQACGGGDGSSPPQEVPQPPADCSAGTQRQRLLDYMGDEYFWYSQLGKPDEAAASQDAYFHSMLFKPADRYSYTQSTAAYDQIFLQGRRTGYGYSVVWGDDVEATMRIRSVEPLSPAALAGLSRGDKVLAIDGLSPTAIAADQLPLVSTAGVARSFRVRSPAGVEREITVFSAEYALSPVAATATYDVARGGGSVKVGYVAYSQFLASSVPQLGLAFAGFQEAGVKEVVLDLRYNGGGSITTARDLASMMGGSRTAGKIFTYYRFNDKQTGRNTRVMFKTAATPLEMPMPDGVERVIVITSGSTASASELVINGLRPHVDVVLVGDTTYGKPYGFVGRDDCGTTYNAVQFQTLNSEGFGDYTAGFAPHCQVPDDLDRQLGDPQEARLRAALDYVANGRCSAQAPQSLVLGRRAPTRVLGETTPIQMFAD